MPHLIKYTLEFLINSSVSILYKRISTASGLSEWFADNVILRDKNYTFIWNGSKQTAILLKKKENHFIRFKWKDDKAEYKDMYFEFFIKIDDLTQDVALIITDFASNHQEKDEQSQLWREQIKSLKRAIGS